jgi:hypothetical protein
MLNNLIKDFVNNTKNALESNKKIVILMEKA